MSPEPKNKRGESKQDYETPRNFLDAVEHRFGKLTIDLAARADNTKAPIFISQEQDSLTIDWSLAIGNGIGWLNPPFGVMEPWARKCRETYEAPLFRGMLLCLTPAAVGSKWFSDNIHNNALVLALQPRLIFDGMKPNPRTGKVDSFPKDCILSVFGHDVIPGFDVWRWDAEIGLLVAESAATTPIP